jgi:hypothetical protein
LVNADAIRLPLKIILQRSVTDHLLIVLPKLEANEENSGENLKKVSNGPSCKFDTTI